MKSESFDVFWLKAILPYCNQIYNDLSSQYIKSYNVTLDTSTAFKNRVCSEYDEYRRDLHLNYFNNVDNALIDRHKICSCIMGALIKCRSVSYSMSDDMPVDIFLSNYKIAFFAGVKSLYFLRIAQWLRDGNMEDHVEALSKQEMFKFPKTQPGHDEYSLGRIKALALTDCHKQDFDVLAYADMLYWIERFNEENISNILNQSDK